MRGRRAGRRNGPAAAARRPPGLAQLPGRTLAAATGGDRQEATRRILVRLQRWRLTGLPGPAGAAPVGQRDTVRVGSAEELLREVLARHLGAGFGVAVHTSRRGAAALGAVPDGHGRGWWILRGALPARGFHRPPERVIVIEALA